jgi:hypothetical protein
MKKLVFLISITAIVSWTVTLQAQKKTDKSGDPKPVEQHHYKGAIGVLGGITMVGLQGEYTFIPELGIRAVGLYIFGADFNSLNRDEYIVSAILTPVLHLTPNVKILDLVLMMGLVYSYHHWETRWNQFGINSIAAIREGYIQDFTFGFGFGFIFKFADRLKAGVNVWLNYDYSVVTTSALRKRKGNRIILPVPLIEFTVQF